VPDKNPENYSFITYLWVLVLSMWGGTAHTIRKIRNGELKRFSLSEWIGDMVISGFIGVMTFYLCEYANFPQLLTAALVGITAHQGAKGIGMLEKIITKRMRNIR